MLKYRKRCSHGSYQTWQGFSIWYFLGNKQNLSEHLFFCAKEFMFFSTCKAALEGDFLRKSGLSYAEWNCHKKNPFCNKMGRSKTDILKVNIYAQSKFMFEKSTQEYVQKNTRKVTKRCKTKNMREVVKIHDFSSLGVHITRYWTNLASHKKIAASHRKAWASEIKFFLERCSYVPGLLDSLDCGLKYIFVMIFTNSALWAELV